MGPIESSRSVNSYSGSIGPFSKVQKNGQQKTCNLFCNIAAKRVEYRCRAFYHPHKTCLATNQVVNRFERGWWNAQYRYSTRFAAMLQKKLYVFCCPFFRTRSFMKRSLTSLTRLRRETSVSIRKKCPLEPGVVNGLHLKEIKGAFCLKTEIFRRPFFYQ